MSAKFPGGGGANQFSAIRLLVLCSLYGGVMLEFQPLYFVNNLIQILDRTIHQRVFLPTLKLLRKRNQNWRNKFYTYLFYTGILCSCMLVVC